jgi:VanZ family protein
VRKIVISARIGAWLAVIGIVVLSTVPGKIRPDVLGNKSVEHFCAYFVLGSLFSIGYPRPSLRLSIGLLFATCAGLLELVQISIPGRIASSGDFVASTLGAWIGLLVVVAVERAHERMFVAP